MDARITTEDGANIDEDFRKLQAMSDTVNEKAQEKNKKLSDKRVASQKVSHRNGGPF